MTGFRNAMMGAAGAAGGGYAVDNSAVFNDDDSQYLTRTNASATTTGGADAQKKFTISLWWKHGNIPSGGQNLYVQNPNSSNYLKCAIAGSGGNEGALQFFAATTGAFNTGDTTAVLRDFHAWYHILFYYDSTDGTAGDRARIYLNGIRLTDFQTSATNPGSGATTQFGSNNPATIGRNQASNGYSDGYMAEMVVIDGQALTPSSFTESDDNGVLRPLDISKQGFTFGDQGFYLNFASSGSDLGDDASGNSNDFTNNNSATQTTDSPTSNFAVSSPLQLASGATLAEGNLKVTHDNNCISQCSMPIPSSGKYYFEVSIVTVNTTQPQNIGLMPIISGASNTNHAHVNAGSQPLQGVFIRTYDGKKCIDGNMATGASYGSQVAQGSILQVAVDADNGTIWFGDDNTWMNSATASEIAAGTTTNSAETGRDYSVPHFPTFFNTSSNLPVIKYNFGQTDFAHTPPTGYVALNAANAFSNSTPTIEDSSVHFQATTYGGNSGSPSAKIVTQSGNSTFQPDLVWLKEREGNHGTLIDAVRGGNKGLYPSLNFAEYDESNLSFRADGFSLSTTGAAAQVNSSSNTYIAWQWKAGDSNTVVSESGTGDDAIAACTHRANQTAGFSIVTYQGKNDELSDGQHTKVAHGLGKKPALIIGKNLAASKDWFVMSIPQQNDAHMHLNLDTANSGSDFTGTWSDSDTTHFVVGNDDLVNEAGANFVAYVWAEIPGYSKFAAYIGNGNADGPFIETGFKPAFILARPLGTASDWSIFDNGRSPVNVMNSSQAPNSAGADYTHSSAKMDFLSNGVKMRGSFGPINTSGQSHLLMCFAEHPFAATSPATAR